MERTQGWPFLSKVTKQTTRTSMTMEIDIENMRNKAPHKVELSSGKRGLLDPKKGNISRIKNS